jgi:bifunctional DNase/RNase
VRLEKIFNELAEDVEELENERFADNTFAASLCISQKIVLQMTKRGRHSVKMAPQIGTTFVSESFQRRSKCPTIVSLVYLLC